MIVGDIEGEFLAQGAGARGFDDGDQAQPGRRAIKGHAE